MIDVVIETVAASHRLDPSGESEQVGLLGDVPDDQVGERGREDQPDDDGDDREPDGRARCGGPGRGTLAALDPDRVDGVKR